MFSAKDKEQILKQAMETTRQDVDEDQITNSDKSMVIPRHDFLILNADLYRIINVP